MIMSEKQTAAVERKQRICDRYKGADTAEVEVIPAKPTEALEGKNTILRVAAYVRVSTDNDEQLTSYELQKNYYTDYISSHPGWVLAGIYADEAVIIGLKTLRLKKYWKRSAKVLPSKI